MVKYKNEVKQSAYDTSLKLAEVFNEGILSIHFAVVDKVVICLLSITLLLHHSPNYSKISEHAICHLLVDVGVRKQIIPYYMQQFAGAPEPWGQGGQMTPRNFPGGQTWYFDPPDFTYVDMNLHHYYIILRN